MFVDDSATKLSKLEAALSSSEPDAHAAELDGVVHQFKGACPRDGYRGPPACADAIAISILPPQAAAAASARRASPRRAWTSALRRRRLTWTPCGSTSRPCARSSTPCPPRWRRSWRWRRRSRRQTAHRPEHPVLRLLGSTRTRAAAGDWGGIMRAGGWEGWRTNAAPRCGEAARAGPLGDDARTRAHGRHMRLTQRAARRDEITDESALNFAFTLQVDQRPSCEPPCTPPCALASPPPGARGSSRPRCDRRRSA